MSGEELDRFIANTLLRNDMTWYPVKEEEHGMANPSGKKGYAGEAPVLDYLKSRGFFRAFRRRTQGVLDKGDIGGIDNVVIEIKNHGVYKFGSWMKELAQEKSNALAWTAGLVVKPKGVGATRVRDWWVMMTLEDYTALLERAGYGPIRRADETLTED